MSLIGVISDTHGLLRTSAAKALTGVDHIIHAGDVGSMTVLEALNEIAPVNAVRGNMDRGQLGDSLPPFDTVQIDGMDIYVIHDIALLDLDPEPAGFSCVIFGHSHEPAHVNKNGVLYLNPGSAGPKRFRLPVTIAHLNIDGTKKKFSKPRFINLED